MNYTQHLDFILQSIDFNETQHLVEALKKSLDLQSHKNKINFIKEELANNTYEINESVIAAKILEYTDAKHVENKVFSDLITA